MNDPAEVLTSIGRLTTHVVLDLVDGRTSWRRARPTSWGSLVKALRRRHPSLPVVALVREGELMIGVDAVRWGARDFLVWPTTAAEVARLLREPPSDETPRERARRKLLEVVGDSDVQAAAARLGVYAWRLERRLAAGKSATPQKKTVLLTRAELMAAAGITSATTFAKWGKLGLLPTPLRRVSHGFAAGVGSEWPADALKRCEWFKQQRDRGVQPRAMLAILSLTPVRRWKSTWRRSIRRWKKRS